MLDTQGEPAPDWSTRPDISECAAMWSTRGYGVLRSVYTGAEVATMLGAIDQEFDETAAACADSAGPVRYVESTGASAGARMLIYHGPAHVTLPAVVRGLLSTFFAVRRQVLAAIAPTSPVEHIEQLQSSIIMTAAGQAVEPHDDGAYVASPAIALLHLTQTGHDYGGGQFSVTVADGVGKSRRVTPEIGAGDVVFFPPQCTHEVSALAWGRRTVISVGRPTYGPEALTSA